MSGNFWTEFEHQPSEENLNTNYQKPKDSKS